MDDVARFDPRLVRNLRRFRDRAEARAYLDFVGDLFAELGLRNDDRRFHFNPTDGAAYVLPFTVNNRYITAKGRDWNREAAWWLIHPGPENVEPWEAGRVRPGVRFAARRHDPDFLPPALFLFPVRFVLEERERVFGRVAALARRELEACRGTTPARRAHSPGAYALALDDTRREEALRPLPERHDRKELWNHGHG